MAGRYHDHRHNYHHHKKIIIVTNLALQAEQAATPCLARLVESEDKG
jgi:hypothetical protein